jgi:hypothetical protein
MHLMFVPSLQLLAGNEEPTQSPVEDEMDPSL